MLKRWRTGIFIVIFSSQSEVCKPTQLSYDDKQRHNNHIVTQSPSLFSKTQSPKGTGVSVIACIIFQACGVLFRCIIAMKPSGWVRFLARLFWSQENNNRFSCSQIFKFKVPSPPYTGEQWVIYLIGSLIVPRNNTIILTS